MIVIRTTTLSASTVSAAVALSLLVGASSAIAAPLLRSRVSPTQSTTVTQATTTPTTSTQATIVSLTNAERQKAGIGALKTSPLLNQAAQRHAEDMARTGQFSHTGSNGSTMSSRVRQTGYVFRAVAENIFMQSPNNNAPEAVRGWMNSSGHRRNLLNARYTEIGIGYAVRGNNHYYVQVFGTPQ